MSNPARRVERVLLETIRIEGIAAGRRGDNSQTPNAYTGFMNAERARAWREGFDLGDYQAQKEFQDAEENDKQYELFKKNMQRFIDERKLNAN